MTVEEIRQSDKYFETRSKILQSTVDFTLTEYIQDLKTRIKYSKGKLKNNSKPFDREQAKIRLQAYIDLYNETIDEI